MSEREGDEPISETILRIPSSQDSGPAQIASGAQETTGPPLAGPSWQSVSRMNPRPGGQTQPGMGTMAQATSLECLQPLTRVHTSQVTGPEAATDDFCFRMCTRAPGKKRDQNTSLLAQRARSQLPRAAGATQNQQHMAWAQSGMPPGAHTMKDRPAPSPWPLLLGPGDTVHGADTRPL